MVVGAYHHCWFVLLIAQSFLMYMVYRWDRVIGDTMAAAQVLSDKETPRRVKPKVVLDAPTWPVARAPPMQPDTGSWNLVSDPVFHMGLFMSF